MKDYTQEEIANAMASVPPPIRSFISSTALRTIYTGIREKHKLNLRQIWAVTELSTVTLLGLESQSAFETNLHQLLPELSNATTHELVADVNTRIFKEARRRLEESVIEANSLPAQESEEERARRKEEERIRNLDDDDPELLAILEKERAEIKDEPPVSRPAPNPEGPLEVFDDDEPEEDFVALLEKIEKDPNAPLPKSSFEEEFGSENAEEEPAQSASSQAVSLQANVPKTPTKETAVPLGPPIALQKLSAPSQAQQEIQVTRDTTAIQGVKKIPPPPPRLKGDSDPYRESPE
jgi:hypothetical protein